jgi:hypothetical protein
MEVSGELHAPAALPPETDTPAPLGRLGGPQSRSGRGGERRKFPSFAGNRTLVVQLVA